MLAILTDWHYLYSLISTYTKSDDSDGCDGFSDSRAGIGKIVTAVTAVTVVTRSLIERQTDASPGVGAGAFIADMICTI